MLLGREQERLALDRLLAEARDGRSGVLALVGEPGIGKTALLQYAAERADGMRVLRARGIESEAEIPFAGLAELLRPALSMIDRIPAPQASALAGALALGPAAARDRFAVGAATLSLLSAYAEESPLALLIDDAHLLDGSSAEALRFAARRLVADPIALVLAVREGEPSLLDGADLRVLRLAGLDRSDARALLDTGDLSAAQAEHLYRATGGNPLALLELGAVGGLTTLGPADVPIPISARITAAFIRRFAEFAEPTRRVLVVAATSDTGEPGILSRAARALGLEIDDLTPAEQAGLIRRDGDGVVRFVHPLARSAVYADAPPHDRRAAHAALASVLPDRDVDRRAWHLAAASSEPNDAASSALEQAGARALARSAYAVAAAAFERAGRLATSDDARASLLIAAAEAWWLAGSVERTRALLDEAAPTTTATRLVARIGHLRGQVAMRVGPVGDGVPLVVSAAELIADDDPELAVLMLAEAVHGAFYAGDTAVMLSAAERAVTIARRVESPRATFLAAIAIAIAFVLDGQGEAGMLAARQGVEILDGTDELRDDPRLLAWAALGPMLLRETDIGRGLIELAFERARSQTALGVLPALLHHLARDQATTDRWPAAESSYGESIRLAREIGQRSEHGAALAGLAWLEARQGREDACRRHAQEAQALCGELGLGLYGVWAVQALGDLELALGNVAASVERHLEQVSAMHALGIADVDLSPAPELVEALLRLGNREEAAAIAATYDGQARAKGQPWVLARAARCRGLLADDADLSACFEEALAQHARTLDVFETARTQLAYGARLRRARRRVRARDELRAAHASFDRLGAALWADVAAAELAATGETARRRDVTTIDELTPQELQIAMLLAAGRTTREAAAAVFLSPKTIEYHLRHVYRKLDINTREALADALGVVTAREES